MPAPSRPYSSAAEHDQASGDCVRGGDLAVDPRPGRGQTRDRGHRGSAPTAIANTSGASQSNSPTRDAAILEAGNRIRVIHVMDDLIAAREHRVDLELAGHNHTSPIHASYAPPILQA
jgi:hypothetical protein